MGCIAGLLLFTGLVAAVPDRIHWEGVPCLQRGRTMYWIIGIAIEIVSVLIVAWAIRNAPLMEDIPD